MAVITLAILTQVFLHNCCVCGSGPESVKNKVEDSVKVIFTLFCYEKFDEFGSLHGVIPSERNWRVVGDDWGRGVREILSLLSCRTVLFYFIFLMSRLYFFLFFN